MSPSTFPTPRTDEQGPPLNAPPLICLVNMAPVADRLEARLAERLETRLTDRLDSEARAAQQLAGQLGLLADRATASELRIDDAARYVAAVEIQASELERRIAAIKTPRPTELNIRDAGCRPNDRTFDNGPILNRLFANLGSNPGQEPGWIDTSLYWPAGGFYFSTPLEEPKKTSLRIRGNGLTGVYGENSYYSPNRSAPGGAASRGIYIGPAESPALTMRSAHSVWDGITLQRGTFGNGPLAAPNLDGSVGIRVSGEVGPGTGKHDFRLIGLLGFNVAFEAVLAPGGSHADECDIGHAWVQDCTELLRSSCPQTTGWHFGKLAVAGQCSTVFNMLDGGGLSVEHLNLMSSAQPLLMKLKAPREHVASYAINYLKIDGACTGWRLVETGQTWGLMLRVWGEIGKGAVPGESPVLLRDPNNSFPARYSLDVSLWDGNTNQLWDWKRSES